MHHTKMEPAVVAERMRVAKNHLIMLCMIYRERHRAGKWFLHEHPPSAGSRKDEKIKRALKLDGVDDVRADECTYGLLKPSANGPMLALQPTGFMSNSAAMLLQLNQLCSKNHKHQPLESGRCAAAAFYPKGLIKAILKGIRDSLRARKANSKLATEQRRAVMAVAIAAMAADAKDIPKHGELGATKITKVEGGKLNIDFNDLKLKAKHYREYNGKEVDQVLVLAAMMEEMSYLNEKEVWHATDHSTMKPAENHTCVRTRWAPCNRGDAAEPDVRGRLAACEITKDVPPLRY